MRCTQTKIPSYRWHFWGISTFSFLDRNRKNEIDLRKTLGFTTFGGLSRTDRTRITAKKRLQRQRKNHRRASPRSKSKNHIFRRRNFLLHDGSPGKTTDQTKRLRIKTYVPRKIVPAVESSCAYVSYGSVITKTRKKRYFFFLLGLVSAASVRLWKRSFDEHASRVRSRNVAPRPYVQWRRPRKLRAVRRASHCCRLIGRRDFDAHNNVPVLEATRVREEDDTRGRNTPSYSKILLYGERQTQNKTAEFLADFRQRRS